MARCPETVLAAAWSPSHATTALRPMRMGTITITTALRPEGLLVPPHAEPKGVCIVFHFRRNLFWGPRICAAKTIPGTNNRLHAA